jgi:hypothetical protein
MAIATKLTIEELNLQTARIDAETRKLMAETDKLKAEKYKLAAEELKLGRDTMLSPWTLVVQALIGGAALFGTALALLKYLAA